MPVMISFTRVFHATSFTIATTARKQVLPYLLNVEGEQFLQSTRKTVVLFLAVTAAVQGKPTFRKFGVIAQSHAELFPCPARILGTWGNRGPHALIVYCKLVRLLDNTARSEILRSYPSVLARISFGTDRIVDHHRSLESPQVVITLSFYQPSIEK